MAEKWLYKADMGQRTNSCLLQPPLIIARWGSASYVWPKTLQITWGWSECALFRPRFKKGLVAKQWEGTLPVSSLRVWASYGDYVLMPGPAGDGPPQWLSEKEVERPISAWRGTFSGASLKCRVHLLLTHPFQCWSLINISHPRFHLGISQYRLLGNPSYDTV